MTEVQRSRRRRTLRERRDDERGVVDPHTDQARRGRVPRVDVGLRDAALRRGVHEVSVRKAHDLRRPRRIDAHDGVAVAGEILSEFAVFRDRRAESGHQHDNRRALALERGIRDVCHVVGCIDAVRRSRKSFFQGAFLPPKPLIGRRLSVLLEVRKDFLAGYLRHFLPLRVNGVESFLRFMCARRRHRDEVSIAHDHDTRHSFCRGVIV